MRKIQKMGTLLLTFVMLLGIGASNISVFAETMEKTGFENKTGSTSNEAEFYAKEKTDQGITITIRADKGVFPKGTTVKVKDVAKKNVQTIISNTMGDVKDVAAVDITFYNKGKEIEPAGNVEVRFVSSRKIEGDKHKVIHIKDDKKVEEMGFSDSKNASFTATSFSIYAIVGTEKSNEPVRKYEFYSKNKLVDTQILKNGEKLVEPSIPDSKGNVFLNWIKEDGSKFDAFGTVNDISKKETVKVYAKYKKEVAVTFYNAHGEKIAIKVGEKGEKIRTDDISFELSVGKYIHGWCKTPNGTESVGKEISLGDQDVSLYPLINGGKWLFFNGNEGDGNSVNEPLEPQFVREGHHPKSFIPERRGYEFSGWYEDKECTKAFDFNKSITENKEVFAKWIAKESGYTVKIWQQKCVDGKFIEDHYVMRDVKIVKAMSDSSITKDNAETEAKNYVAELMRKGSRDSYNDYYHFDFNSDKTSIENNKVRGDGSSVVNIYYDLHSYTIKFHKKNTAWPETALDESKFTAQMIVDGKPYDKDFYLVENYHVGEKIENKRPDVKAIAKEGVSDKAIRTGWVNRNEGGGIVNFITYNDNSLSYVKPNLLVRETVPGFETINFYPVFPKKLVKVTVFDYVETMEKGIYEENKTELTGSPSISFSASRMIGFTRVPLDEAFSKKIKVKRTDGHIEEITLPDKKTQKANYTFYNIHNRNTYELTFFNKSVVEKSYRGDHAIPYNATIEDKIYTPKKPLDLSDFYTFKGWANRKGEIYDLEKIKKMPSSNLFLYAQWEIKKVNVRFDSNGGTAVASQTINALERVKKPQNPIRAGFQFAGWALPNGSPFNFSKGVTTDMQLIARWVDKKSIVVKYNAKEGSQAPIDHSRYVDVSNVKVLGAPKVLPRNKFFKGWELDGVVYYPGQFCLLKSKLATRLADGKYEITLNAVYTDATEKTKLIYHANFGSNRTVEKEYINNSDIRVWSAQKLGFNREGYEFMGWNTRKDGSGISYGIRDEIRVDNNRPLPNELFAQWKKKQISNRRNSLPKTADNHHLSLYVWTMLVSAIAMVLIGYGRKEYGQ